MANRNLLVASLAVVPIALGYAALQGAAKAPKEEAGRRGVAIAMGSDQLLYSAFEDGTVEYMFTLSRSPSWKPVTEPIDWAGITKERSKMSRELFDVVRESQLPSKPQP